MMPLVEIDRLARTVDEAGRCGAADTVAARWGHPAGTARWWRSSASHVFVLPSAYLRFMPASWRSRDFYVVAQLMKGLAERGVALARPISTVGGALVETVETDLGAMHAMCVAAAPGRHLDVEALTLSQIHAWGTALAQVHETAAELGAGLPQAFAELDRAAGLFADDPPLVRSVQWLTDRLSELPRDPSRYGVIHGDFELDNLAWTGDIPTSFDYDEAAHSWYVADIAAAVRDLTAQDHLDAFITGYRRRRPLPEIDLLPLFATAGAATRLIDLRAATADGSDELPDLRTRLNQAAADSRRAVLDGVLALGQVAE
jgi:Ser/Thr protein kinase RdoA (MazF antagonist)